MSKVFLFLSLREYGRQCSRVALASDDHPIFHCVTVDGHFVLVSIATASVPRRTLQLVLLSERRKMPQ